MCFFNVQSLIHFLSRFLQVRARDMWKEMVQIQAATGLPTIARLDRTRRQTDTYDAQPAHYAPGSAPGTGGTPMSGSCCTCQVKLRQVE